MNNKIIPIALAVSLTVNVFVAGAVVGALGQHARIDPQRPGPGGNPLMRAADQLPEPVRMAYRQQLRAQAQAAQPLAQVARAARLEAAQVFAQPSFDKAAAVAALAKSRAAETAVREKLEAAVVDFAAGLPADQRRQLGAALGQPPRGGRGGRGGPGGGRMGGGMGGGPPPFDRPGPDQGPR